MTNFQLYPPGQDHFLYVMPGRTSGFPLDSTKYNSPIDAYEPNLERHPLFAKATAIEFEQLPGELLFIPTGWFHQVSRLSSTLEDPKGVSRTWEQKFIFLLVSLKS